MTLRGGYNLNLKGRPSSEVKLLPKPEQLLLPLKSERFNFSEICVQNKEEVKQGQPLAWDRSNYSLPLLAPLAGKVNLESHPEHLVLENLKDSLNNNDPNESPLKKHAEVTGEKKRQYFAEHLVLKGVWQYFYNAQTLKVPDPLVYPGAIIINTVHDEPFDCRGDVLLRDSLTEFMQGLEILQQFLDYEKIYLCLPDIQTPLANKIKEELRGRAFITPILIPLRYPYNDLRLLTRHLNLKTETDKPIWGIYVEGILAVQKALVLNQPTTSRTISLGGPAVESPCHLQVMSGYPLKDIFAGKVSPEDACILKGSALTGKRIAKTELGLDNECTSLTAVSAKVEKELLAFAMPGFDRKSNSKCFLSSFRKNFLENKTIALMGERRPCVSCGMCEEICPAGIIPHLLHKLLHQDALEEAEIARVDLCIHCGLCSYVCPSKIELREQMIKLQSLINELHTEEVEE